MPQVTFNTISPKEYKTSIVEYLASFKGEMITEASEQLLKVKKQEFYDWIKSHRLDYLFNVMLEKTVFEWYVFDEITSILKCFDSLIESHDEVFGKPIDRINNQLRETMTAYSTDYENEFFVDNIYTDAGQVRRV